MAILRSLMIIALLIPGLVMAEPIVLELNLVDKTKTAGVAETEFSQKIEGINGIYIFRKKEPGGFLTEEVITLELKEVTVLTFKPPTEAYTPEAAKHEPTLLQRFFSLFGEEDDKETGDEPDVVTFTKDKEKVDEVIEISLKLLESDRKLSDLVLNGFKKGAPHFIGGPQGTPIGVLATKADSALADEVNGVKLEKVLELLEQVRITVATTVNLLEEEKKPKIEISGLVMPVVEAVKPSLLPALVKSGFFVCRLLVEIDPIISTDKNYKINYAYYNPTNKKNAVIVVNIFQSDGTTRTEQVAQITSGSEGSLNYPAPKETVTFGFMCNGEDGDGGTVVTSSGFPGGSPGAGAFTGTGPVTINNASPLPNATIDVAYSENLTADGGAGPPYSWSITVGDLPTGLVLNVSTGGISGTPTAEETFTFTVQATAGAVVTKEFSITVERGGY